MAFGPQDRVVKAKRESDGSFFLAHLVKGADQLWRQECGAQPFTPSQDGASLYQALRQLVDHCPRLVELEP